MIYAFRKTFLVVLVFFASTRLLAQGIPQEPASTSPTQQNQYTPPSTPELYDVNEPLVPLYVKVRKIKNHAYLGLGSGFGQSLTAGAGKPITAWNIVADVGYVRPTGAWSRLDMGLEIFHGQLGGSERNVRADIGVLAKVGYGYNISENVHAILRGGVGIATANYTVKDEDGNTIFNSNSASGTVWQVAFQLLVPTQSDIDILGGLFFNQYGFAVNQDHGVFNVFDARLGLRYRI